MPGLRSLVARRRATLPTPDTPQHTALYPVLPLSSPIVPLHPVGSAAVPSTLHPCIPAAASGSSLHDVIDGPQNGSVAPSYNAYEPSRDNATASPVCTSTVQQLVQTDSHLQQQEQFQQLQNQEEQQKQMDFLLHQQQNRQQLQQQQHQHLQQHQTAVYTRTAFSAPPPTGFTADYYAQHLQSSITYNPTLTAAPAATPQTPAFLSINAAATASTALGYGSFGAPAQASLLLLPNQTSTYAYVQPTQHQSYLIPSQTYATQPALQAHFLTQSAQLVSAAPSPQLLLSQQSYQSPYNSPNQNSYQSSLYSSPTYAYQSPAYQSPSYQPPTYQSSQTFLPHFRATIPDSSQQPIARALSAAQTITLQPTISLIQPVAHHTTALEDSQRASTLPTISSNNLVSNTTLFQPIMPCTSTMSSSVTQSSMGTTSLIHETEHTSNLVSSTSCILDPFSSLLPTATTMAATTTMASSSATHTSSAVNSTQVTIFIDNALKKKTMFLEKPNLVSSKCTIYKSMDQSCIDGLEKNIKEPNSQLNALQQLSENAGHNSLQHNEKMNLVNQFSPVSSQTAPSEGTKEEECSNKVSCNVNVSLSSEPKVVPEASVTSAAEPLDLLLQLEDFGIIQKSSECTNTLPNPVIVPNDVTEPGTSELKNQESMPDHTTYTSSDSHGPQNCMQCQEISRDSICTEPSKSYTPFHCSHHQDLSNQWLQQQYLPHNQENQTEKCSTDLEKVQFGEFNMETKKILIPQQFKLNQLYSCPKHTEPVDEKQYQREIPHQEKSLPQMHFGNVDTKNLSVSLHKKIKHGLPKEKFLHSLAEENAQLLPEISSQRLQNESHKLIESGLQHLPKWDTEQLPKDPQAPQEGCSLQLPEIGSQQMLGGSSQKSLSIQEVVSQQSQVHNLQLPEASQQLLGHSKQLQTGASQQLLERSKQLPDEASQQLLEHSQQLQEGVSQQLLGHSQQLQKGVSQQLLEHSKLLQEEASQQLLGHSQQIQGASHQLLEHSQLQQDEELHQMLEGDSHEQELHLISQHMQEVNSQQFAENSSQMQEVALNNLHALDSQNLQGDSLQLQTGSLQQFQEDAQQVGQNGSKELLAAGFRHLEGKSLKHIQAVGPQKLLQSSQLVSEQSYNTYSESGLKQLDDSQKQAEKGSRQLQEGLRQFREAGKSSELHQHLATNINISHSPLVNQFQKKVQNRSNANLPNTTKVVMKNFFGKHQRSKYNAFESQKFTAKGGLHILVPSQKGRSSHSSSDSIESIVKRLNVGSVSIRAYKSNSITSQERVSSVNVISKAFKNSANNKSISQRLDSVTSNCYLPEVKSGRNLVKAKSGVQTSTRAGHLIDRSLQFLQSNRSISISHLTGGGTEKRLKPLLSCEKHLVGTFPGVMKFKEISTEVNLASTVSNGDFNMRKQATLESKRNQASQEDKTKQAAQEGNKNQTDEYSRIADVQESKVESNVSQKARDGDGNCALQDGSTLEERIVIKMKLLHTSPLGHTESPGGTAVSSSGSFAADPNSPTSSWTIDTIISSPKVRTPKTSPVVTSWTSEPIKPGELKMKLKQQKYVEGEISPQALECSTVVLHNGSNSSMVAINNCTGATLETLLPASVKVTECLTGFGKVDECSGEDSISRRSSVDSSSSSICSRRTSHSSEASDVSRASGTSNASISSHFSVDSRDSHSTLQSGKGVHIVLKKLNDSEGYSCFRTKRKLPAISEPNELNRDIEESYHDNDMRLNHPPSDDVSEGAAHEHSMIESNHIESVKDQGEHCITHKESLSIGSEKSLDLETASHTVVDDVVHVDARLSAVAEECDKLPRKCVHHVEETLHNVLYKDSATNIDEGFNEVQTKCDKNSAPNFIADESEIIPSNVDVAHVVSETSFVPTKDELEVKDCTDPIDRAECVSKELSADSEVLANISHSEVTHQAVEPENKVKEEIAENVIELEAETPVALTADSCNQGVDGVGNSENKSVNLNHLKLNENNSFCNIVQNSPSELSTRPSREKVETSCSLLKSPFNRNNTIYISARRRNLRKTSMHESPVTILRSKRRSMQVEDLVRPKRRAALLSKEKCTLTLRNGEICNRKNKRLNSSSAVRKTDNQCKLNQKRTSEPDIVLSRAHRLKKLNDARRKQELEVLDTPQLTVPGCKRRSDFSESQEDLSNKRLRSSRSPVVELHKIDIKHFAKTGVHHTATVSTAAADVEIKVKICLSQEVADLKEQPNSVEVTSETNTVQCDDINQSECMPLLPILGSPVLLDSSSLGNDEEFSIVVNDNLTVATLDSTNGSVHGLDESSVRECSDNLEDIVTGEVETIEVGSNAVIDSSYDCCDVTSCIDNCDTKNDILNCTDLPHADMIINAEQSLTEHREYIATTPTRSASPIESNQDSQPDEASPSYISSSPEVFPPSSPALSINCRVSLSNVFCGWQLQELSCPGCLDYLSPKSISVNTVTSLVEMLCFRCHWLMVRRITPVTVVSTSTYTLPKPDQHSFPEGKSWDGAVAAIEAILPASAALAAS